MIYTHIFSKPVLAIQSLLDGQAPAGRRHLFRIRLTNVLLILVRPMRAWPAGILDELTTTAD